MIQPAFGSHHAWNTHKIRFFDLGFSWLKLRIISDELVHWSKSSEWSLERYNVGDRPEAEIV